MLSEQQTRNFQLRLFLHQDPFFRNYTMALEKSTAKEILGIC